MKRSYFIIYFLLAIFPSRNCFGQNKEVESLIHYFETARFTECDSAAKAIKLNLFEYLQEDSNKINISARIVSCLIDIADPDTARRYANALVALSDKLHFKRADAHWIAATAAEGTPEAIRGYLLTVRIAEEAKDTALLGAAYARLGLEYQKAGNYTAAVEIYLKRLKLGDPNSRSKIPTLQNLSGVYADQHKYDEALKIMRDNISSNYRRLEEISLTKPKNQEERKIKAIDSMETLKQIATDKLNAAMALQQQQQFEAASKYFKEVMDDPDMNRFGTFNGVGYYPMMAVYYLAALYLEEIRHRIIKMKEPSKSLQKVLDTALMYEQLFLARGQKWFHFNSKDPNYPGNKVLNYYLYSLWGVHYYTIGIMSEGRRAKTFYDSSIHYFETSMADSTSKARGGGKPYGYLSRVFERKGDYKNALKYTNLLYKEKDSTLNNETNNKIEQLRIQYEVETATAKEKAEKEKELLAEKTKHDEELSREKLKQVQFVAEEKARHEKALLEEDYRHQTAMAQQKLSEEQLLSQQKLQDAQQLASEKARLLRVEADEKLRHERALYEEQIMHQDVLADQKRTQDRLIVQKEKKTNEVAMGSGVLFIAGLFTVLFVRQRSEKRRAIEKAHASHRMTELELQSLRAQLNPHFMFNSLSAIQELILLEENDKSHEYLTRFAKLVRALLDNADQPFISLKKEVDFLELYLSLERLRVPDLNYSIEINPGISPEQVKIPNMILQPYIENAIWHGLSHKIGERRLSVKISARDRYIVFQVIDNGVGRKKAAELKSQYRKEHNSKGMELLSKRFKLLAKEYGTNIRAAIIDLVEGGEGVGTMVEILVPQVINEAIKPTNYVAYHNN